MVGIKFISDNFFFNGISNSSMNVVSVDFDNSDFIDYGLLYSKEITEEVLANNRKIYLEGSNTSDDIVLQVALIDEFYNPKKWDNYTLHKVVNWFKTDEFVEFISEDNLDIIYYVKATNIKKHINGNWQGYIEVTLRPFSNYIYTRKIYETNGNTTLLTENISSETYRPIIEISNATGTASFKNTTTNKDPLIINSLKLEDKIIIDNEMCTIETIDEVNKFKLGNRKWLELQTGNNELEIVCNGNVKIKAEFPILI